MSMPDAWFEDDDGMNVLTRLCVDHKHSDLLKEAKKKSIQKNPHY
jgi:hypothetical protein